jgi:hypothetical protein
MRPRDLLELFYAVLWKLGLRFHATSSMHREVFTGVYTHNECGSEESRSGLGSTRQRLFGHGLFETLRL